jgi:hypothetical protein
MRLINNSIFWFLAIFINPHTLINSYDNQCIQKLSYCECKAIKYGTTKFIGNSISVENYIIEVENYVGGMKKKEIKKVSNNCTKTLIAACLLKNHPQIDSIQITPSGHGISFYNRNDSSWLNLIIK